MNFLNQDDTFAGIVISAPESNRPRSQKPAQAIFEEKIEELAESQVRSEGMGIALAFIEDGDYSADYLEAMLIGFVDEDGNEELSDDEAAYYEELATSLVNAFVALGASEENAVAAVSGDNDAAEQLGDFLAGKMEDNPKSDDEIVSMFAVEGGLVLEAVKRVFRGGKLKTIRVPTRKKRLSAAQRAGLRKARMKANTSAAKRARAKAMRQRKSRGL